MATITQNVDMAPFWPRPFWPPRNWWLALLVILVLAGALRFPGYGFSLPYLWTNPMKSFSPFREE